MQLRAILLPVEVGRNMKEATDFEVCNLILISFRKV